MPANNSQSARPDHPLLEPDREQLRIFIETIFRHAGDKGFVSLRAFYEGNTTETSRITPISLSGGLDYLVVAAEDDARRAAQLPRPTVFCPPLAVFNNKNLAREVDVALGLVIAVECDQHPKEARAKLEAILGPATVVVKSGGRWTNGSDVAEDKLHLYWVLAGPAGEVESLRKLKQARTLATRLVEGDASGRSLCHPYRWPGSWHRKGEPRMCVIESVTDNEIDLDTALQKLKIAVPDADLPPAALVACNDDNDNRADGGLHYVQGAGGEGYYDLSLLAAAARLVQAAVKVIPNDFNFDQPSRDFWIKLGIAIYYATRGSEAGRIIFEEWSMRSPKYDVADNTGKAWASFKNSDGRLGYRYLDWLASIADPSWDRELFPNKIIIANNDNDSQSEQGTEQKTSTEQQNQQQAPLPLLQSNAQLVGGFVPPDYLIDGVLIRRFIYALTAPTNAGKTAVALCIVAHVITATPLAGYEVEQGKVLYLAAENPDDVRMRWIKFIEEWTIDPNTDQVRWIPSVLTLSNRDLRLLIKQETEQYGPFTLVVVDTSAAYFEGDDSNNNAQMAAHARRLRGLIRLVAGGPTVLVTCHPVKNYDPENLIPYGGGAFLNEIDTNLVLVGERRGRQVDLHYHAKIRGPDFAPISFQITPGTSEQIKDSKGRLLWTVTARAISPEEKAALEGAGRRDEDLLLLEMARQPGLSLKSYAEVLGWVYATGQPDKSRVERRMKNLKEAKLVRKERDRWALTRGGEAEANRIAAQAEAVPF